MKAHACRLWSREDALQPLEALEPDGVFATIMTELAGQAQETDTVMIDATHLKTHRTASSLGLQKGVADG